MRTAAHIFLPRTSNNHKPKLLHNLSLAYLSLFLILAQFVIRSSPSVDLRVLGYAANISPAEVIRLTNEKRAENGLGALKEDPLLTQAALEKGTDMLNKDYWAHVSPDGVEPWAFFANVGYVYRYAGENLARDFTNPKDAVDAWMASPSHRDNLLSPKYNDIGIAVVEGDLGGVDATIIVQLFGTKSAQAPEVVPVAQASEQEVVPVPTSVPSPAPSPAVVALTEEKKEDQQPVVVAQSEINTLRSGSFDLIRTAAIGLSLMFIIVLLVDAIMINRKKIRRYSGRAFAHISFMGMILAIALIAKAGRIF